jgi:ketosteroid isomerase-like protein
MARSTEQVFQDHMKALLGGELAAMMADYADDAVLMTMEGANVGKAAIQGYFVKSLSAMPNFRLSLTGHRVHGDFVLVTWTGVSDVATIPHGVDTFVIHDDKIRLQTVWIAVVPK